MFCDFAFLDDFDPTRPWVGGALVVAYFAIGLSVMRIDKKERISVPTLQLVVIHVVMVPYLVYLTVWCYQHPELLANDPDGWMSDFRPLWPFALLIDGVLIAWFIYRR